jgi:hypothetical protein
MAITTTEIARYSVNIVSEGDLNQFAATVWLYGTNTQTIGFLRFYRDGVAMPANEFRTDLGYPIMSFRADALPAIVDVLRNEKPLFLTWFDYSPTPRFGTLGTSREPVGEAEP